MYLFTRNNDKSMEDVGNYHIGTGDSIHISREVKKEEITEIEELEEQIKTAPEAEKESLISDLLSKVKEITKYNELENHLPQMPDLFKRGKDVIRINPSRIFNGISDEELETLTEGDTGFWMTLFFASLGIFGSTASNAIASIDMSLPIKDNMGAIINLVIAAATFVSSIISFIVWQKQKSKVDKLKENIRSRTTAEIPK